MHPCHPDQPATPLIEGSPDPACRAIVIIPARNEEAALPHTLDALRLQVDAASVPLEPTLYEVIVLLNNCTDASAEAVRSYQVRHPAFALHVAERSLPPEIAHVGTARRMLMDTACERLERTTGGACAILSTDADTTVAPDWVFQNLRAIEAGAEAVGGVIQLNPDDIALLDPGTLHAYRNDRRYQRNVARLESLLDPDPWDPWPRHLEHFGASLACTPAAYRRAGGVPPVKPLEDVAFIAALRRVGARLRHAPEVRISTSARLEGRAEVGLSGQLRCWQREATEGLSHTVQSAAWLSHRFSSLAQLRHLWAAETLPPLGHYPACWRAPVLEFHPQRLPQAAFLSAIDCDRLIEQTFRGAREGVITRVIADLGRAITRARSPHSGPERKQAQPVPTRSRQRTPAG